MPNPFGPTRVVTGQIVADFLGQGGDEGLVALAEEHLLVVIAMVDSYTRGRGFHTATTNNYGEPFTDVAAVIITATARMLGNPQQAVREQAADYSIVYPTLHGWTLPELAVLHRYRLRAA